MTGYSKEALTGERYGRETFIPAALIALLTALFYWRAVGFDFITLDDLIYVVQNPTVTGGLTVQGIKNAFTQTKEFYWLPATWLSLMADAQYSGAGAEGFHRTNVILHGLNAMLLYLLLVRATNSPLKSLAVCALFALHPLRVESVAWVTSRKDLLSGFFMLISLLAYVEWAKSGKKTLYWLSASAMALGVMSKPVAVAVPFLMLTLDLWPLGRSGRLRDRLAEKTPFFLLFGLFSIVTIYTQGESVIPLKNYPLFPRLEDTVTVYLTYLKRTFWPFNLVLENRIDTHRITGLWAALGFSALAAFSWFLWRRTEKTAPLFAGWLWFVFSLAPVCGLITVGANLVADRFTYLPHMGLFTAAVYFPAGLAKNNPAAKKILAAACVAAVAAFGALSFSHLPHWKNSETLYEWNNGASGGNSLSLKLLGDLYLTTKRFDAAYETLKAATQKDPNDPDTYNKLALSAWQSGRLRDAEEYYLRGIGLKPDYWVLRYNMGLYYKATGKTRLAAAQLKEAATLMPSNADILVELAQALQQTGDIGGAIEAYEAADRQRTDPETRFTLATLLAKAGQPKRAIEYYELILKAHPDHYPTMFNIAMILEEHGDKSGAAGWLRRAIAFAPDQKGLQEALRRVEAK